MGVSYGSPPSAWKAKGELEGVVVHYFLSLFSERRRGIKGDEVAPIRTKAGLLAKAHRQ